MVRALSTIKAFKIQPLTLDNRSIDRLSIDVILIGALNFSNMLLNGVIARHAEKKKYAVFEMTIFFFFVANF